MKTKLKNLKQKFKKLNFGYFVIIISIIGIIILYLISTQTKPKEISISEVENYEGKYVIVEGVVTDVYTMKTKSKLYTIREDNSTVLVFVEKISKDIEIGDKIKVEGKVQKYQDDFEIVVLSDKSIEILEHWDEKNLTLQQLASRPENYIETNINITGYAIYVSCYESNTTFYLTDNLTEGKNSLKVICNSTNSTVQNIIEEDFVCVKGKFVYDEYSLRYVVEVEEKEHGVFIITL